MAHPYGQQPYGQAPYGAPPQGQYPGQPGYGAPPPAQYVPPPAGQYGAPGGMPGQPGMPGQMPYGGAPIAGPPPGMDPQVYLWFQSVDTDRSGQITAIELQQALVNANWSHFNAETTRLMIGMFDRDFSGTINLQEFAALWNYIQQWKGVFEQTDQNRTGSIEAHELTGAFQRMGYNVSPQFANMVVCKFDTLGRRQLTLDNFIQACVMLKTLTDNFVSRDAQRQGNIRLSYEEFMCLAVANKP
ncbi:peflin-like [Mizuhopecten yessoensis]|uniref:Peflin n=1 Tax=Mizuhopecten yessoensis TaxID=6573 RepID=A0A210Q8W3_MIZYE|nr:peflin-like [Mizuhopecten yessoensis]OWF45190.1 Peflin [Mizuhopecten yessoensis]